MATTSNINDGFTMNHENRRRPRQLTAMQCVANSLHILPTVTHRPQKVVIAQGGASYHLPEHTLAAYKLALEMGADFISSTIVATQDGRLIATHSVDLNVTTNVEQVFGETRQPWFSPHAKREGYWTFNFTYDEISQLGVKQRVQDSRTTRFDDMFHVPLLEEVVDLLITWNHEQLPQTISHTTKIVDIESTEDELDPERDIGGNPSPLQLAESGLFLELKEVDWFFQEADLDLVNILLDHMNKHESLWNQMLPCFQEIKYDTYKVPGLVIQSHNADALERFHKKWVDSKNPKEQAEPLYVLLIDSKQCNSDRFWSSVHDTHRATISGIGPDKQCLFFTANASTRQSAKYPSANVTDGGVLVASPSQLPKTLEKAREFNLAVHPRFERPEKDSLVKPGKFNTAKEETSYLFCQMRVEGIYTEAVTSAVSAAQAGCDPDLEYVDPAYAIPDPVQSKGMGQDTPPTCTDSKPWLVIYLALIFFILGFLVACCSAWRQRQKERSDKEGHIHGGSEGYSDQARSTRTAPRIHEAAANHKSHKAPEHRPAKKNKDSLKHQEAPPSKAGMKNKTKEPFSSNQKKGNPSTKTGATPQAGIRGKGGQASSYRSDDQV